MAIIQNKDIYDSSGPNPFQSIVDMLELLDKNAEALKLKLKSLETTVKNSGTGGKGAKELITSTQQLTEETKKLVAVEKAKAQLESQLAASVAKYAALQEESAKELIKVRVETQNLNRQRSEEAKINSETTSTLVKMRLELRQAKSALLGAKEGTKEYNEALKKAAKITDDLGDAQARIKGTAMDFEGVMSNVTKVTSGVASAFEAAQGASALFGDESEELQKAMLKVQASIALANGLQGLDGLGKNLRNLWTQIKQTVIFQKIITAAQWLWNAALMANPIGLIVGAVVALGAAIYGTIKYFQSSEEAIKKENTALDGLVTGSKEAAEAHNESIKVLKELDQQYQVVTGRITENEKALIDLSETYLEEVANIRNETRDKLDEVGGFWRKLYNSLRFETESTTLQETKIRLDGLIKQSDAQKKYIAERKLLYEKENKERSDAIQKSREELQKLLESNQKDEEAAYKKRLEQLGKLSEASGRFFASELEKARNFQIERNEIVLQEAERSKQEEEDKLIESEKRKEEIKKMSFDASLAMAKTASKELDRQYEEDLEKQKELEKQKQQIIGETFELAGQQLGMLLSQGQLSFKEFGKIILTTALDIGERMIQIVLTEILAREIAKKSWLGIASAAALIGIVKGAFAGMKANVMKFAEGTDYVNGPGSERSDSIPAMLSKGEGIINARNNMNLLRTGIGVNDKRLPSLVAAGMNTFRMESELREIKNHIAQSSWYLSNFEVHYEDSNYKYIKDVKTGIVHKIIKA